MNLFVPLSLSSRSSTHPSRKRFGQNFLVDNSVVDRIIKAVHPLADETIIEIGPGRGALTKRLVEKAGRVVAIEFDRDLISDLQSGFPGTPPSSRGR